MEDGLSEDDVGETLAAGSLKTEAWTLEKRETRRAQIDAFSLMNEERSGAERRYSF